MSERTPWIIRSGDAAGRELVGGKAWALRDLGAAAFSIPDWFVVTPEVYRRARIPREHLSAYDALSLPEDVRAAVERALDELDATSTTLWAVRSSAVQEDSGTASFAGQLESYLFVPRAEVLARIVDVWRSGFTERVLEYRKRQAIAGEPDPPAVIIQRMVEPDVAGVAFSADPATGDSGTAVIASTYGLGTAIVSGDVDGDTHRVDAHGRISAAHIAAKKIVHRRGPSGVREEPVPLDLVDKPALSDRQVLLVAALARRAEQHFGRPQDIEWAFADGNLYLLQSRPITTAVGRLTLWDNSNIAESYGGTTTPLTFSFVRRAYEHVYREFCIILGVPSDVIEQHRATLENMLGLIQGRIYYNLLSWYRILATLPGFESNRKFMEQMMGVRETLPDELLGITKSVSSRDKAKDRVRLLRSVLRIMRTYRTMGPRIRDFHAHVDLVLGTNRRDLLTLSPHELVEEYRMLEREFIARWRTPLLNDFYAMIFFGVLRRLVGTWGQDKDGTLQNDLLCDVGGMISAEPARRILALADLAAADPDFVAALRARTAESRVPGPADTAVESHAPGSADTSVEAHVPGSADASVDSRANGERHVMELGELRRRYPQHTAFWAGYDAYLTRFGERCMDELKLESPTLHDDPTMLVHSIAELAQAAMERRIVARQAAVGDTPARPSIHGQQLSGPMDDPRGEAEIKVRRILARQPLRRLLFDWVLRNARARVRDRENLRFERTRVFGRVRGVFVQLGHRLHEQGLLADPSDVFYLEIEELIRFVDGSATTTDLQALVDARRREFAAHRSAPKPAERFQTRGTPYHRDNLAAIRAADSGVHGDSPGSTVDASQSEQRKGLGCCPGVVEGIVQVIRDPSEAVFERGHILVAERTDPSWILLFPLAKAVLVERGSLLSHAAIVSRELGIPSVVALSGVTDWLKDGDRVRLDGSTGVVQKL